jgi:hypothetical protein
LRKLGRNYLPRYVLPKLGKNGWPFFFNNAGTSVDQIERFYAPSQQPE